MDVSIPLNIFIIQQYFNLSQLKFYKNLEINVEVLKT